MPHNPSLTIRQAIAYGQQELHDIDDSLTIIYSLLGYSCSLSKEQIWQYLDNNIPHTDLKSYKQFIARAKRYEPLAYILGYADFYDLRFTVTRDTLIPRPESEIIIDFVLNLYPKPQTIVDVGTGSGCLALTLARHLPDSHIYATDVSESALKVAQQNASRLQLSNVTFEHGPLLSPLEGMVKHNSLDLIVANLPYISDAEYDTLPRTVRDFEPSLALRSGSHADALNRQLIEQSKQWLSATGRLFYETTNGKIVSL